MIVLIIAATVAKVTGTITVCGDCNSNNNESNLAKTNMRKAKALDQRRIFVLDDIHHVTVTT